MHITVITPAAARSRSGNRVTAVRQARLLRELGHRVRVAEHWDGGRADLMVAIHAWRSREAVAAWRARAGARPLVVLLAGTDVYRFQASHPRQTRESMEAADRLVGLHDRVGRDIPREFESGLRVIHQSALPLPRARRPSQRTFDVCVAGHLREEKDPLRAALAARLRPPGSRLRVLHLGRAHDEQWARAAREEMAANRRYHWRGEVAHGQVRRAFGRCHAMVMSSRLEGGANVVSEAVVAGLPVIASHIPGNVGLLGERHPAYYPAGDTAALAALLARAEEEPGFLDRIAAHAATRAHLFRPERERERWAALLAELGNAAPSDAAGRPHRDRTP